MQWSPKQAAALTAVAKWFNDPHSPQVFRLFGYAGTGKTTLAKEVNEMTGGSMLVAAYTGKASLVLRRKGLSTARTIHSLIYKPVEDEETGETHFEINPDSDVSTASLVCIDEVSMVGEEIGRDLLSYGTKVLVLGDPFQLQPVKGEGFFTNVEPDILLTEIHRQAESNPIIRMSLDIREGRELQPGQYGSSRVVLRRDIDKDELREVVLGADQVLAGKNATRRTFNARIRALKGFTNEMPQPGDRLVCLRNNKIKGLLNGGLWDVESARFNPAKRRMVMLVQSIDDPSITSSVDVEVPREFFLGTEENLDWRERKRCDQFTFGNVLTVHKSQGSQWDRVALFDESSSFRDQRSQHLYTGITRAAEQVTVVV